MQIKKIVDKFALGKDWTFKHMRAIKIVGDKIRSGRNTWLDANAGGLKLIKMQLSAFSLRSKDRICNCCGEEVKHLLHMLDCTRMNITMACLIREVESLTVDKGLAKDIWDVIKYP